MTDDEGVEHLARELVRADRRERSVLLADRRAHRVDDECVRHRLQSRDARASEASTGARHRLPLRRGRPRGTRRSHPVGADGRRQKPPAAAPREQRLRHRQRSVRLGASRGARAVAAVGVCSVVGVPAGQARTRPPAPRARRRGDARSRCRRPPQVRRRAPGPARRAQAARRAAARAQDGAEPTFRTSHPVPAASWRGPHGS